MLILVEVAFGGFAGFDLVLIGSAFLLGGGIGMLLHSPVIGFVYRRGPCCSGRESRPGSGRREVEPMNVQRWIRVIAGTFVTASVALGWFVSPRFFAFTAFVGANLFQSAFSGWCPMMSILKHLGVPDVCPR